MKKLFILLLIVGCQTPEVLPTCEGVVYADEITSFVNSVPDETYLVSVFGIVDSDGLNVVLFADQDILLTSPVVFNGLEVMPYREFADVDRFTVVEVKFTDLQAETMLADSINSITVEHETGEETYLFPSELTTLLRCIYERR